MTPDEFRAYGYQLIDRIADYRARLHDSVVRTPVEPGSIKSQLPVGPPSDPEPFAAILRDFDAILEPGLCHWQHPQFFGYFPSNAPLASVLGDYLSTGLGVLGLSWQSSPSLTELEEVTLDWVRQMVGLSTAWQGVIQDTASTSTLVALICARERASNYAFSHGGLQAIKEPLVVYVSEQSHSSVEKGCLLAGFGRQHLRRIGCDHQYAMRPELLEQAICSDVANGCKPCAVVATSGTTATTAFDPLDAIARIAREQQIWMHVDAAMAGSAMIVPDCRKLWDGIEGADSLVINAHKWLGAVFDCSLYYVRDVEHLVRVMSTSPSYLQTTADGQVKNYRDWGIPLGRRFRALKLWCLLRAEGVSGLQARIRRDLENARWLEQQIRITPNWKVVAPVQLQTVCFRHEPTHLQGEALDRHTLTWVQRVNNSGVAYLTPAMLDGRWMVRASIGVETTERVHVERMWQTVQTTANAALSNSR